MNEWIITLDYICLPVVVVLVAAAVVVIEFLKDGKPSMIFYCS